MGINDIVDIVNIVNDHASRTSYNSAALECLGHGSNTSRFYISQVGIHRWLFSEHPDGSERIAEVLAEALTEAQMPKKRSGDRRDTAVMGTCSDMS